MDPTERAKLIDEALLKGGEFHKDIALKYGVSRQYVTMRAGKLRRQGKVRPVGERQIAQAQVVKLQEETILLQEIERNLRIAESMAARAQQEGIAPDRIAKMLIDSTEGKMKYLHLRNLLRERDLRAVSPEIREEIANELRTHIRAELEEELGRLLANLPEERQAEIRASLQIGVP